MKKVALMLACMVVAYTLFGQTHWPRPTNFSGSVTANTVLVINGEESLADYIEIGAFCGEECRGAALPFGTLVAGHRIYFLSIAGNTPNQTITFRLWDHQANQELEYECQTTINFQDNLMLGQIPDNLFEIEFTAPQATVTQTIALVLGYNPVSTYLDVTLDEIKASLVSAFGETTTGIKVIAPDGSSSTYSYRSSTGYYWRGNVNNWDVTQSLTVYAPVVPIGSFVLEGERLGSVGISIVEGYNCITYPCDTEMPFATAFAGFAAVNGDKVIAPDGSSATYNGTTWRGQLSRLSLVPGAGYTYFSASATSRTLTFPSGGGGK